MPASSRNPLPFAHLHARSWFSFLAGASPPEALVAEAHRQGVRALALTDRNGVYGAVRFQKACKMVGIKPLFGAEVTVEEQPLVLIAENQEGFSNLNRMLTAAHQRSREAPSVTLMELMQHAEGLFCLTGAYGSHLYGLIDGLKREDAFRWVQHLHSLFGDRLSIEIATHVHPGDRRRMAVLERLSRETGVSLAATAAALHARPEEYRRYDLMTCIRHNITIFDDHPERPRNAEAFLRAPGALQKLIPYPQAFLRTQEIADRCTLDLIPGYITPPAAAVPPPHTARAWLHSLCREAFARRYPESPRNAENVRKKAAVQLRKELDVIGRLELDEFFLVVHEIVDKARELGIRCAGRGSAANSIVAYLLGITGVDPVRNKLLFERFLHAGRKGTPDIDVDFDSDRRDEIIAWMEERFGMEQTAMTATLITYRVRSAVRDVAKAFGWPMDTVNRLSKAVPPYGSRIPDDHRVRLERIVGASPLLDKLLEMAQDLMGAPRHLGLHSGGMILSRTPLSEFTPVQVSANGVKVVQFDKDDVEALGLVKFDVLGLRMLATLSEADELIQRHTPPGPDIDELPLDDIRTFNMIRASKTLGVFQIESQGQLHLLAQHQPEDFQDLINEIALFRPGPLQSGMVHPFVRRRRGLEPVTYPHPLMEPLLRDTYGVIVYQEQVLEVAHKFAHMSLEEADEFRRLMSKFRDPGEMEGMRDRFVAGAMKNGVDRETATAVFENVANFVGYGFCRSHAAAFAKTVYQSAYLKRHHTAAYLAAFMQHRPGMYNLMTLEEEARRFGVRTLLPDINRSMARYDLEWVPKPDPGRTRHDGEAADRAARPPARPVPTELAIRKPLSSVQTVTQESARDIVWERLNGPYTSVRDLYERVPLTLDQFRNLARSGALDGLAGDSRRALWEVGLLHKKLPTPGRRRANLLFDLPPFTEDDVPDLPSLTLDERLSWDYESHHAARIHPMALARRTLNEYEIRPIASCFDLGRVGSTEGARNDSRDGPVVTVAGIAMLRQRPKTANGVMFLTLEDETGFVQTVIYATVLDALEHIFSQSAMIVRGQLQVMGNWRGLVVQHAWALDGILGGYEGHPSMGGGRDKHVKRVGSAGRSQL
ncbi:MAG: DNA polymerase III subunit alpha [Rhodothermales bacterium]